MRQKIIKLSLFFTLFSSVSVLSSCDLVVEAKINKFNGNTKVQKLHKLFNLHDLHFKTSSAFTWGFLYSLEFVEDVISNKFASEIQTTEDLDQILKFFKPWEKMSFIPYGVEAFDESGTLVIYFLDNRSDKYNEWKGEELTNFENDLHKMTIGNFKKKTIIQNEPVVAPFEEINNRVGIKTNLDQDQNSIGNGMFFNYIKTDDQSYPTKWFILSAGHLFFDQMDKDEFEIVLFNTISKEEKYKAKVFLDGRDHWNVNTEVFKQFLPEKYKNERIHSYLDYAIIEIDFKTPEEAKKWTSTKDANMILSDLYLNKFETKTGYFDVNDENKNVYKELIVDKRYLQTYYKDWYIVIDSYNHFFSNKDILNFRGTYYIDLSNTIVPTQTKFSYGSSGLVEKIDDTLIIKIASNAKEGLWLPTKSYSNYEYTYEPLNKKYITGLFRSLLFNFQYDIFKEDNSLYQVKSFEKTFKEKYPANQLGYEIK